MVRDFSDREWVKLEIAAELGIRPDVLEITPSFVAAARGGEIRRFYIVDVRPRGSRAFSIYVVANASEARGIAKDAAMDDVLGSPSHFSPKFWQKLAPGSPSAVTFKEAMRRELQHQNYTRTPAHLVARGEVADWVERETKRQLSSLSDAVEWIESVGGARRWRTVLEDAGIGWNTAADAALEQNGVEHYLPRIIGSVRETPSGFAYWEVER
jgi:hypothetical protein